MSFCPQLSAQEKLRFNSAKRLYLVFSEENLPRKHIASESSNYLENY